MLYIFSKSQSRKNISGMRKIEFISSLINSERINIDNFEDFENLEVTADKQAYIEFYSRLCLYKKK